MSSAGQTMSGEPRAPILQPYLNDPDTASRRRRRRWIYAGVAAFCLVQGLAFAFLAPFLIVMFAVPIAVLGALVIWALPAANRVPLKTMEFCFFALFITLIMWPDYLAIALPGLPWITMIRLTGFPMAISLLIVVSQSAEFRGEMARILKATPILWNVFIAFVALQCLTVALSHAPFESLQRLIVAEISCTAVFFVSAYVFSKPGMAERWSMLLWALIVVLGFIAIQEARHSKVPWAGHIPGFLKIEDPIVQGIMQGGGRRYTGIYRTQATFSTSLGFGEFVAIASPFIIHFIVADYKGWVRLGAIATVPLLAYTALLTGSRSAILGCLISLMLWLFFWGVLRWKRQPRSLVGPSAVLAYPAMGVVVFAATFLVGKLHRAVWGGAETADSTAGRVEQWHKGIPLILKNPIGNGIGRGGATLDYHEANGILTIDSGFLNILLEYGVVGFLLFYGIFVTGIFYATRSTLMTKKEDPEFSLLIPLSISLACFLVIKMVFAEEGNYPLVFMIIGMIAALVYRMKMADADTEIAA